MEKFCVLVAPTYLLTVNPDAPVDRRKSAPDMVTDCAELFRQGANGDSISLSMYRNREIVQPGHKYLLLLQGKHARGIISSGLISSIIGPDKFYYQPNKSGFFVNVCPDLFVDPYTNPERRLDIQILIKRWPIHFENHPRPWIARSSGQLLPADLAHQISTAFIRQANT